MLKIVMPIGGEGRRFAERGYTFPKPLIEIKGQPMIELVVRNITPSEPHQFVFVCRREHQEQFALADVLRLIQPGCAIVTMDQQTKGALCTVLLAMAHLPDDDELLVANADQLIDVSIDDFLASARRPGNDGHIMTFPSSHPKWSYVQLEEEEVVAVAEKRPISNLATAGLYYFRRAGEFLELSKRMILKNAAVMGQFYVCPVYNEYVLAGKHVRVFGIKREQMHSLGTPEDVDLFIGGSPRPRCSCGALLQGAAGEAGAVWPN